MNFENWIKILTVAGAIVTFVWGVWQWKDKSDQDRVHNALESNRLAETRRLEATKPFLERQLKLYTEASQVAAHIATQGATESGKKARARFWELYWGELALVENREVETAMKRMGDLVLADAPKRELELASLRLAHACRASLDKSWGIQAWSQPDEAASRSSERP